MSFSGEVKNELCRVSMSRSCCARAELYGALLYCNTFTTREVRVITESDSFARRLPQLLERAFGMTFDRLPGEDEQKYIFQIAEREKLEKIIDSFGFDPRQNPVLHINFALVEEDCCRIAFLRGAFLTGGYVSAPGRGYHLELVTSHYNVARQTVLLLEEMGLSCGFVSRRGNFVLYYKDSNVIEEIVGRMGAPGAAMDFRLRKVEKDFRNNINRRVNCETANLGKTVEAAARQCHAIGRLEKAGQLEQLPESLRETARVRMEHPEESLTELLQHFDPPLSRPGLNNRLRKLEQLAAKLED